MQNNFILPTDILQLREFMLIMKNKAINYKEITENFDTLSYVHLFTRYGTSNSLID